MKKLSFHTLGTLALCLTVCLSSCNDANLTLLEGTALGTTGGGGLGYGVAKAFGASDKDAGYAALGGAALGGFLGYQWGASVVKQKNKYSTTEACLKANIKQVNSRISDAQKANSALEKELASLKSKKTQLTQAAYKQAEKTAQTQKNLIDKDIDMATQALKGESGSKADELRSRVAELKRQRTALTNNVSAMKSYIRKV